MTVVVYEEQGVDLEDALMDHLGDPTSAMILYRERLSDEFLFDPITKKTLNFTFDFIREEGEPPGHDILNTETGFEFGPPVTPIDWVIERLRNRYKMNQGKAVVQRLAKLVVTDPDEAVRYGDEEFAKLRQATITRRYERDTGEAMSAIDRYVLAVEKGLGMGVTFGWEAIDEDLIGLRPGTLSVVVARPKRGKSWLLLQSACKAWEQGENVDFYTLELTLEEMEDRFICMLANVPYWAFVKKRLTPEQFGEMRAAAKWAESRDNKLRFLRPNFGERTVSNLQRISREHSPAAVYVDQLSWLDAQKRMPDQRWREIEFIVDDLKAACDDFPIYVAAQFNREAAGLDEMADLSKIGLSDRIGQTADLILGVHQSKEMKENNLLEFGVVDARSVGYSAYELKMNLGANPEDPYLKYLGRKED